MVHELTDFFAKLSLNYSHIFEQSYKVKEPATTNHNLWPITWLYWSNTKSVTQGTLHWLLEEASSPL